MHEPDPILNGGTDPDSSSRRSGSSANDPHGGHEHHGHELKTPEANPVHELVPGGQGAEPPPYRQSPNTPHAATTATEAGRMSDDLGAGSLTPGDSNWLSKVQPAVDPTSPDGLRHEGMVEGGTGQDVPDRQRSEIAEDDAVPTSSAYTGAQVPNVPRGTLVETDREAQGAGIGQEPVERRANVLVFDDKIGNFQIKDEEHATGVTSQDHDLL